MKIEFTPTFWNQYLASLIIQVKSPFMLIISLIFPAAGLFILTCMLLGISKEPSFFEIIIIPLAFGFTPIITALSVYLARRKNKTIGGAQTYQVDDIGIEITGSTFKTHLQWQGLYQILETGRFFFFYLSPRMAYFIPKSIFNNLSEVDELKKLLVSKAKCKNNL